MRDLFHIQERRTEITVMLITVIVGFLLVTQLRGQAVVSSELQQQSERDLSEIVHEINTETDVLREEVAELQIKLYRYQQEAENEKSILTEAREDLKNLKIVAGLTEVEGPGVKISITDSDKVLNTFDFIDVIQELKVGGAEAIAVDNRRVVQGTYFKKKNKQIYVDNRRISSPYMIEAIGDPQTLYQAVTLTGGCKDKLTSLEGVILSVTRENNLAVPAVKRRKKTKYTTFIKES